MQRKDVADIRIDTDSAVTLVNEKKNEVLSLLDNSMLGEAYLKYDGLTTEAGARKALEDAGIKMASAEVSMIPQTYVSLTDETDLKNINKILDLLDDDDDVQEVYHNWEE